MVVMASLVKQPPIGVQLRELRLRRGLSLRDVQSLSEDELTWQALSRLELGDRNPRQDTLITLARALDVEFLTNADGTRIVE